MTYRIFSGKTFAAPDQSIFHAVIDQQTGEQIGWVQEKNNGIFTAWTLAGGDCYRSFHLYSRLNDALSYFFLSAAQEREHLAAEAETAA